MIKSDKPYDYSGQIWRGIDDKFPKKIHNATSTSDGLMSSEDKAKLDAIDLGKIQDRIYDIATQESDGLMSKEDKIKMDGIEDNANNYIHPNTPNIRHVTDDQITYWNAKASTAVANQESDGLMSAEDKKKLDSIAYNANNYVHPNNEGIRHVTDAEKDYWNSKADKDLVTNSENGLMAAVDKVKLDGIEPNANNYVHPDGPNFRHVTDEQIKLWDSKSQISLVTHDKDGLMSAADKNKLDSLLARFIEVENQCDIITENYENTVKYDDALIINGGTSVI